MRGLGAPVGIALFLAMPARAQAPALVPVRVELGAGLRCGSAEDFAAELAQRSGRVRAAQAGEAAFVLRVEVTKDEGALLGRLTLREPSGDVTVRVVPGADCEEVTGALAVIAAVLLEPEPAPARVEPPPVVPRRAEASPWAIGASAGVVLQGAVAPEPAPAAGVEAHLAHENGSVVSPLFALAYSRTLAESNAPTPNGTAALEWWSFRASVCPLRWPGNGPLALRPCGSFDLGRVEGQGVDTEQADAKSVLWVAPGTSARFDAAPVDWLVFTAEAGLFTPLNRDRFVFDTGLVAFAPPELGGFARLAVGGRFQ